MVNQIPFWHPAEYVRRLPLLKRRAAIIEAVRQFFISRDFWKSKPRFCKFLRGLNRT